MERAEILVDLRKESGIVDRKLFGHFMEHAFGNIYGGIYDPGNKNAGPDGLREDVIKLLKECDPRFFVILEEISYQTIIGKTV